MLSSTLRIIQSLSTGSRSAFLKKEKATVKKKKKITHEFFLRNLPRTYTRHKVVSGFEVRDKQGSQ